MAHYIPFSGNPLDRASNQRHDDAWIETQLAAAESLFLPYHRLNVLAHHSEAPALSWLAAEAYRSLALNATPVLLGVRNGIAHFALDVSELEAPLEALGLDGPLFEEVRGIATNLSPEEAGIVAHGRAALDWHRRHRFCGVCGSPTMPMKAGSSRKCEGCGQEHFPRTDPVVIMVVWRGDRCLLGRRAGRPNGAYSAIAGYIDQGETIEEAVRRECLEEVGVEVDEVVYHASQPWPFPSTLMIGCFAHSTSDEAHADEVEIADATWFTRDEVKAALRAEAAEGGLVLPGPVAIAHHLLRDWAELEG